MSLIINLIEFIAASIFAFYIPGRVALGKIQVSSLTRIALSLVVGIVFWGWQGFIFGYLQIRGFSYIYLLIFLGLFLYKKYYQESLSIAKKSFDWVALILCSLGVFSQTLPYYRMGWPVKEGISISEHNVVDHIWHVSLVNELIHRFPPNEPGMANVLLKDYHFWFNLVTAELIRVFHLSIFTTQFIGMYMLGSIIFGILLYAISQQIFPSKAFGRWVLFFGYFSGDAAGWVMLFKQHQFTWSIASLINDATKLMDSPAYGYAMVILLTAMYLLFSSKRLSVRIALLCAFLLGSLIEFKVYVGIPWMLGFGALAFFSALKKQWTIFGSFILACILGLIIFLPATTNGGGLIFLPFETPRNFITQKILGVFDWELRWYIYQAHHNTLRIIQYGVYMSLFYIVIQFGILLLGIIPFKKSLYVLQFNRVIFLYVSIIAAILLGLLFYQKVGGANIWEFFLATFPILGIIAALHITLFLEKKNLISKVVITAIIVLFTMPRWFLTVSEYIQQEYTKSFHGIGNAEYASYQFLKNNTSSTSVVFIFDQKKYIAYASIASVLTDRQLFFSGEGVRQQVTPIILKRRADVALLRSSTSGSEIVQMLHDEKVSYLYLYRDESTPMTTSPSSISTLKKVFQNSAATIYQVN